MLRDFRRSPEITPDRRRAFLQRIAIYLSRRNRPVILENDFRDVVAKEFRSDIRRHLSDTQAEKLDTLFADLRSSATLTRGEANERYGWRFSHNTLREYLVAEALLLGVLNRNIIVDTVAITDAMRMFATSVDEKTCQKALDQLAQFWQEDELSRGRGQLLSLLWDGFLGLYPRDGQQRQTCLTTVAGEPPQMANIALNGIDLSKETDPLAIPGGDLSGANLAHVGFTGADLSSVNFTNSVLENVSFENANLENARFDGGIDS